MFSKARDKVIAVFAVALAMVLVVPVMAPQTAVVAEAATKTTVWLMEDVIGVNGTTKIYFENKKSKASYTFSSSKKSVATVSKKGVITGKQSGTAKITVNQKYKGKTTKVGTVKVIVKKAQIYKYSGIWIPAQPGFIKNNPSQEKARDYVEYLNPKAKYTFYSDNADLVISKDGKVTDVKNSGKANYIIKETYKGKTRTVGKVPVELKEPTYTGEDTIQLYIGDKFDLEGDQEYAEESDRPLLLQAVGKYALSCSTKEMSDEEILNDVNSDNNSDDSGDPVKTIKEKNGEGNGKLSAQSEGTEYCALVEWNYLENKYDKIFKRFQINVSDASKLTDLQFPWEREKTEADDDEEVYTYDKKKNA